MKTAKIAIRAKQSEGGKTTRPANKLPKLPSFAYQKKTGEQVKTMVQDAHEDLKQTYQADMKPFEAHAKKDIERLKMCADILWNGKDHTHPRSLFDMEEEDEDEEEDVHMELKLDEHGDILENV